MSAWQTVECFAEQRVGRSVPAASIFIVIFHGGGGEGATWLCFFLEPCCPPPLRILALATTQLHS